MSRWPRSATCFPTAVRRWPKPVAARQTYPSLEELVKDDRLEAVFVATDAPSHARHCTLVLRHGKHVASAVPAVFGSLEDADKLYEAVKSSGRKYMMFETSAFHDDCHAMRQIYRAGGFGKLIYSEGEYYHYMATPIDSYRNWRVGLPPQWYPTHASALSRVRERRQLHRSRVHGHAQHHQGIAAREQPLQEPVRHRDRPPAHQRRRNGARGHKLGHVRAGKRNRARLRPAGIHGGNDLHRPGARRCPTWSVPRCRHRSSLAATAGRTAT